MDTVAVTAFLDRLLHHAHILNIGVRISETLNLRQGDIENDNLILKVFGKGQRERTGQVLRPPSGEYILPHVKWISGCLTTLLLWAVVGVVSVWALVVALNPWALHIGKRSTPLLYWHGAGIVLAKGGKALPLYVSFWPGRPQGFHGGGRREGKIVSAQLQGTGWLCIAPRTVERMDLIGTMYGGYTNDSNSLLDFRLLEWRRPFAINPQKRGFFDLAGMWRGTELVMNRPNEQGIQFKSGLFIDHAVVTLRWASYEEFETTCNGTR